MMQAPPSPQPSAAPGRPTLAAIEPFPSARTRTGPQLLPATCRAEEPVVPIGVVRLRRCDHLPEIVCRESLRVERIRKRDLRAGGWFIGRTMHWTNQTDVRAGERAAAAPERNTRLKNVRYESPKFVHLLFISGHLPKASCTHDSSSGSVASLLACFVLRSPARVRGLAGHFRPPAGCGMPCGFRVRTIGDSAALV